MSCLKTCNKCEIKKPLSEFYKKTNSRDRLNPTCKSCISLVNQQIHQLWYPKNKVKKQVKNKNWSIDNRDKRNAAWMKRRAAKIQRTPTWLSSEQLSAIEYFYTIASELSWLSEGGLHVDHIVPLQGKNVSGLHVPWNLQVIPASENESKGNKFENFGTTPKSRAG